MATFFEAAQGAIKTAACSVLSDTAAVSEITKNLTGDTIGKFFNPFNFLYNRLCNVPPPPIATSPTGGQCAGVLYTVKGTYEVYRKSDGASQSGGVQVWQKTQAKGPIGGLSVVQTATGIDLRLATGDVAGFVVVVSNGSGNPSPNDFRNFTISTIVREDGQADNCGTLPPKNPPYKPGSNKSNTNITYTTNNNTNITLPVTIAFGYATVNFNGQLTIPISLNFTAKPEFNISGEFNLNTGDTNFTANNPSLPGDCCEPGTDGYKPDPNTPANPDPSDPDIGPPSANPDKPATQQVIRGCVVTTTAKGPGVSTLFGEDGPDIYVPALGYISFQVQIGARTAWLGDYPVKHGRQLIHCPWPSGAIAVKGIKKPGVVWTISPVFTTQTFNSKYPPES